MRCLGRQSQGGWSSGLSSPAPSNCMVYTDPPRNSDSAGWKQGAFLTSCQANEGPAGPWTTRRVASLGQPRSSLPRVLMPLTGAGLSDNHPFPSVLSSLALRPSIRHFGTPVKLLCLPPPLVRVDRGISYHLARNQLL